MLGARFYPNFLQSLQQYAGQFVERGSDSRIVARHIIDNYAQFSSILGRDFATRLLVDNLGMTAAEMDALKL
jgi:hypothetical protein